MYCNWRIRHLVGVNINYITSIWLLVILTASHSFAQTEKGLTTNIRAGITYSKLANGTGSNYLSSLFASGVLGIPFGHLKTGLISLQPGISLYKMGYERDVSGTGLSVKRTTTYIQVPLSLVGYFDLGNGKIFAGLGPYASYPLGSKLDTAVNGQATSVDTTDQLPSYDWGFTGHLGYMIVGGVSANIGYTFGMVESIKSRSNSENRSIWAGLGFSF